jgi:hypothetical protein
MPTAWGGWVEDLHKEPQTSFFIPTTEIKNLECLGFLPAPIGDFNVQTLHLINPYYHEYDKHLEKLPVHLTHGYQKVTWNNVAQQFKLFDTPDPDNLPHEELLWGAKQLIDEFRPYVSTKIQSLDDISVNMKASAGKFYRDVYKSKKHYLLHEGSDVNDVWNFAHLMLDILFMWLVSGKEEYKKFEKMYSGDQRCFEIPPAPLQIYGARVCQYFNHCVTENFSRLPIKTGIVFARGGFHRFISKFFIKNGICGAGDVNKFDKYFSKEMRKYCLYIRKQLIHPESDVDEVKIRLDFLYNQSLTAALVLPWGQVFRSNGRMLSGDWNTSTDNSMIHVVLSYAMVKYFMPNVSSWRDCKKVINYAIYADDHLFTSPNTTQCKLLSSFESRKEFYYQCGFGLKFEDDRVQRSPIGLKFLGATILKDGPMYVPCYDVNRVASSVVISSSKKINPSIYWSKMQSLLILVAYDEQVFCWLRAFMIYFKDLCNTKNIMLSPNFSEDLFDEFKILKVSKYFNWYDVPTMSIARNFWTGYECLDLTTPEPTSYKMSGAKASKGQSKEHKQKVNALINELVKVNNAETREVKKTNDLENRVLGTVRKLGGASRGGKQLNRSTKPKKQVHKEPAKLAPIENLQTERKLNRQPSKKLVNVNDQSVYDSSGTVSNNRNKLMGVQRRKVGHNPNPSVLPQNRSLSGPSVRATKYEQFCRDNLVYLQTLMNPFTCRNVGIPIGNLATMKLSTTARQTMTLDANGRGFFTFGFGRAINHVDDYTLANACSFVPNSYQAINQSGSPAFYEGQAGMISNSSTINTDDLFSASTADTWKFQAFASGSASTLFPFVSAARLVSAGFKVIPFGELSLQKGTMTAAQYPRGVWTQNVSMNDFHASDLYNTAGSIVVPLNRLTGTELVFKPTDDTVYLMEDVFDYNGTGEFVSLLKEDDPICDQGGLIVYFDGGEPGMEVWIDAILNLEAISESAIFLPDLSITPADRIAVDMVENALMELPYAKAITEDDAPGDFTPVQSEGKFKVSKAPLIHKMHSRNRIIRDVRNGQTHYVGSTKQLNKSFTEHVDGFLGMVEDHLPLLEKIVTGFIPLLI